ncbi:MAG: hypothetical protein IJ218_00260 [Alphaproteobacteria bacterium]|nr:hypothetical protein [Alphaproteobacteria bacterium]
MMLQTDNNLMEFLKLSRLKIYVTGMLMLFLCGCGLFNPYIDRRRNPGVSDTAHLYTGPSTPKQPVVCYNPLLTNDNELQQIADAECIKHETGIKAEFVEKTHFDGKLLLPSHAHYRCVKEDENLSKEDKKDEPAA